MQLYQAIREQLLQAGVCKLVSGPDLFSSHPELEMFCKSLSQTMLNMPLHHGITLIQKHNLAQGFAEKPRVLLDLQDEPMFIVLQSWYH